MREAEHLRLTRQVVQPRLELGRNFMPEGSVSPETSGQVPPQLRLSQDIWGGSEDHKRAEVAYIKWKRGRERKAEKLAQEIDIDIPVLTEPPDPESPGYESEVRLWQQQKNYRDVSLRFVEGLVIRRERSPKSLHRDYFENTIAEIEAAVDKRSLSVNDGKELLDKLTGLLEDARNKEEKKVEELASKIAKEGGIKEKFEDLDPGVQKAFKDYARDILNLQMPQPPQAGGVTPGGIILPAGNPVPPGHPPGQGGGGPHGRRGITANLSPQDRMALAEQARREALRYRLKKALGLDSRTANTPLQQERRNELLNANPNLKKVAAIAGNNVEIFKDLRDFIEGLDITETSDFHMLALDIVNLKTSGPNRQISEESRRLLFEWMYEKLIGAPDKGSPEMHYKIGSFYVMDLLDKMDSMARNKFDLEFFHHISELQHVRHIMHELSIALKFGEQYKEFILKELSASGMDFVFNDVAGVGQVFAQIERVGGNMASRGRREWLSDADWREVYKELEQIYEENNPNREIMEEYVVDAHGQLVLDPQTQQPITRQLTDWEKSRAIRLGKIIHAGLQRRGMYSFLGNLPPMSFTSGRIASTQDVYIGRVLMAKKQAAQFFPSSEEESAGAGSKYFLERIADIEIEDGVRDKKEDDKTLTLPLFGFDPRMIVYDDCATYDLMSHSWRSPKEFYDRILINIPDPNNPQGRNISLFEYLGEQARSLDPNFDPILGAGSLGKSQRRELSNTMRDMVLGQRLYLSTFPRQGNFDVRLKTEVWRKIALLTPSSIATLLPESIPAAQQAVWEGTANNPGLRAKLFAAEGRRIKQDSSRYFQHQTMQQMQNERAAFEQIAGYENMANPLNPNEALIDRNNQVRNHVAGIADAANWGQQEWNQILNYMGLDNLNLPPAQGGLTNDEKEVLKGIIQAGLTRAHDLARARMPFTFLIVDAPKASLKPTDRKYGGVNDADYIRLMASDQQTLQEGYNEGFNSLVENPTEHVVERVKKLIDSYSRVHGRDAGLKAGRSAIIAWHQMAAMDFASKWIPGERAYRRIREQATSILEKYWQVARISMNEQQIKNSLYAIGQAVGMSNLELRKLREETHSSPIWFIAYWIRMVIAMGSPAAAEEFLKAVMPKFS